MRIAEGAGGEALIVEYDVERRVLRTDRCIPGYAMGQDKIDGPGGRQEDGETIINNVLFR